MEPWTFSFPYKQKLITFTAEMIYVSNQVHRIKVSAGGKYIVIEGNLPLLKGTNSKKPVKWQLIEGIAKDAATLLRIFDEVEERLKYPRGRVWSSKDHPKNKPGF